MTRCRKVIIFFEHNKIQILKKNDILHQFIFHYLYYILYSKNNIII